MHGLTIAALKAHHEKQAKFAQDRHEGAIWSAEHNAPGRFATQCKARAARELTTRDFHLAAAALLSTVSVDFSRVPRIETPPCT